MVVRLDTTACRNFDVSSRREWMLSNGIGGYAMGTVAGVTTRRYHGHLVAAAKPPADRWLLLANVDAFVQGDGASWGISTNQYPGAVSPEGYLDLEEFAAGEQVVWRWRSGGLRVSKSLALVPGRNAVRAVYRNTGDAPFRLTLRPLVCHRSHHGEFDASEAYPERVDFPKGGTTIRHHGLDLHLRHAGAQRLPVQGWYYRFEHLREQERGLRAREDLYCPCELHWELLPGEEAVLTACTDGLPVGEVSPAPEDADPSLASALRDASRRFLVGSCDRSSMIAGYPWFTDWGRDTMIALPGVCLQNGHADVARAILTDYAAQRHQGLIPNRWVETGDAEYNTVDATLWFANAVYKTLLVEWDDAFAVAMLACLQDVYAWHVRGTLHGIRVDLATGLLTQGEPGVQLTWMDVKVGDWVVTPRHGMPVEVNGLWVNFLRVAEWLAERLATDASAFKASAVRAEASFDGAFWRDHLGYYLDTASPDDASLRPNQVIAMALPFGPAQGDHARMALAAVERALLTPYGLRTLDPADAAYIGRYEGSMAERDAAYHQGTVWPWLLGPFATALVKLKGDRAGARRVLRPARDMLMEYGLSGIAEVYDGDPPHRPGGCPWQAWSVAEILRAWVEDAAGD